MFSVWHSMALYGIVWQCHTELQTMFNTIHSIDHWCKRLITGWSAGKGMATESMLYSALPVQTAPICPRLHAASTLPWPAFVNAVQNSAGITTKCRRPSRPDTGTIQTLEWGLGRYSTFIPIWAVLAHLGSVFFRAIVPEVSITRSYIQPTPRRPLHMHPEQQFPQTLTFWNKECNILQDAQERPVVMYFLEIHTITYSIKAKTC